MGSCAEHLVAINTVLNHRMSKGLPTVLHLYDVRKCFDKVNLWDIGWEASRVGVKGADLRFLMEINQGVKMRVAGDERENAYFVAKDTVGQGMVSVIDGTSNRNVNDEN